MTLGTGRNVGKREKTGQRAGLIRCARTAAALLALLLPAPMAGARVAAPTAPRIEQPTGRLELARNFGAPPKAPSRGSSAELQGGSSADRYGGSSADRRGVAGRYDERNRGVRQFSHGNRKKKDDAPKKKSDELDDQDNDGARDPFTFTPPDPSQPRGGDRD